MDKQKLKQTAIVAVILGTVETIIKYYEITNSISFFIGFGIGVVGIQYIMEREYKKIDDAFWEEKFRELIESHNKKVANLEKENQAIH